jgi:hypothetical protein
MYSRTCWLALLLVPLLVPRAPGCTIPVFRYALERWRPSAYELVLFHRGPLPPPAAALLEKLQNVAGTANLEVTPVDLAADTDREMRQLWEKQETRRPLPWLVLRYPGSGDKTASAWAGQLTEDNVEALLTSPARQRLVRRLVRGDAVWLLLDGEDAAANDKAEALLRRELRRLERQIELPEQSKDGPQMRLALPLRVSFAVLRLSRSDRAEQPFVRLLTNADDGLAAVRGPVALPVFGRGRVLCALHGKQLAAAEVERAARYLCGECSCQTKELNPGVDLLLAADWEQLLEAASAEPVPPPTTEAVPVAAEAAAAPSGERRFWLWVGTVLAAGLVVVTGVWALASRKKC